MFLLHVLDKSKAHSADYCIANLPSRVICGKLRHCNLVDHDDSLRMRLCRAMHPLAIDIATLKYSQTPLDQLRVFCNVA
jgi:hypothetical protein